MFRWQDLGGNFFGNAWLRFRLMLRLMQDGRIQLWLKIIPFFSLVYLVLPFDFPGPIDDGLVIWFAMQLFIELCPQDIVREQLAGLTQKPEAVPSEKAETIIDADFKEMDNEDKSE